MEHYVVSLAVSGKDDIDRVGGKNASLGEMISHLDKLGIRVPGGFATTADAFSEFLSQDSLGASIHQLLDDLNVDDVVALTRTGAEIRRMIMNAPLSATLRDAVTGRLARTWQRRGYQRCGSVLGHGRRPAGIIVRGPAGYAAQRQWARQRHRCHSPDLCFAVQRPAIAYRVHRHFDHRQVSLSVGVQRMVRADLAVSGVMFTLDPESGFRDLVLISSSYGLGETIVQGAVNPDEFYVYKPSLVSGHHAIVRRNLGTKAIKMVYRRPWR